MISYLRNEVGDPNFFAFLTLVTHYLTVVKVKKKNQCSKKIFAQTSLMVQYFLDIKFVHFQGKLSVGKDGTYLEGIHWMNNVSIGEDSCGRYFLCTDLRTSLFFAIKMVRLS